MNEIFARMQSRLVEEEGLSLTWAAILTENALYRFEPAVREAALKWLDGTLTDETDLGVATVGEVRGETGASPFQALCILDALIKDPARLTPAIWQIWSDEVHE